MNQAAYSTLSGAGVPVAWANNSEIFHQKTITVDGAQSAIMTGNLTSQYYATTRDFVIMDSQADDVTAIESVFASDWSGANPSPGPWERTSFGAQGPNRSWSRSLARRNAVSRWRTRRWTPPP